MPSADEVFDIPSAYRAVAHAERAKLRILELLDHANARPDLPSNHEYSNWVNAAVLAEYELRAAAADCVNMQRALMAAGEKQQDAG